MQKCCITIPVYKNELTLYETKSFERCCNILGKYDIYIFTYKELDCTRYCSIASKYGIKLKRINFAKENFDGIKGYNNLLLRPDFYEKFGENYEYLLIYQLDVYVFYDKLEDWCSKGLIYAGAPISDDILNILRTNLSKHNLNDNFEIINCYNGGASLRKISFFIEITKNRQKDIGILTEAEFVEDIIFSILIPEALEQQRQQLSMFCIECHPKSLIKNNHNKLPMLCHKWYSIDSDLYDNEFWLKYIMPKLYYKIQVKKFKRLIKTMVKKIF